MINELEKSTLKVLLEQMYEIVWSNKHPQYYRLYNFKKIFEALGGKNPKTIGTVLTCAYELLGDINLLNRFIKVYSTYLVESLEEPK